MIFELLKRAMLTLYSLPKSRYCIEQGREQVVLCYVQQLWFQAIRPGHQDWFLCAGRQEKEAAGLNMCFAFDIGGLFSSFSRAFVAAHFLLMKNDSTWFFAWVWDRICSNNGDWDRASGQEIHDGARWRCHMYLWTNINTIPSISPSGSHAQ